MKNSYDEIKGLLGKVRKLQVEHTKTNQRVISEQEEENYFVINGLEVEIVSSDSDDLSLSEDEKKIISQLVDDFRSDVSGFAEFDKLRIYPESAKLNGNFEDLGMGFILSTGKETGLYITESSMLKVTKEVIDTINNLNEFQDKFSNTLNKFLVNRRVG